MGLGQFQNGVGIASVALTTDSEDPVLNTEFTNGPGFLYIPEDTNITLEVLKPGYDDIHNDSSWHTRDYNNVAGGQWFMVYTRKITAYSGANIDQVRIGR